MKIRTLHVVCLSFTFFKFISLEHMEFILMHGVRKKVNLFPKNFNLLPQHHLFHVYSSSTWFGISCNLFPWFSDAIGLEIHLWFKNPNDLKFLSHILITALSQSRNMIPKCHIYLAVCGLSILCTDLYLEHIILMDTS